MTDLSALLKAVESASGPDEQLDHIILLALGARYELDWGPEFYWPDGVRFYTHHITGSISDAVALVTRMLPETETRRFRGSIWFGVDPAARIFYDERDDDAEDGWAIGALNEHEVHASTPALAVLAALLQALIAPRSGPPVAPGTPATNTPEGETNKQPKGEGEAGE